MSKTICKRRFQQTKGSSWGHVELTRIPGTRGGIGRERRGGLRLLSRERSAERQRRCGRRIAARSAAKLYRLRRRRSGLQCGARSGARLYQVHLRPEPAGPLDGRGLRADGQCPINFSDISPEI